MTEDQHDHYTCERAREDFSALLDGELNAEERAQLEYHLANGPASCTCLADLEAMRRVGEAYRGLPRAEAPPAFPERVHAAIARRKRWQTARRVAVRRVLPASALAAGLLLVAGSYLWPAPTADPARDTLARNEVAPAPQARALRAPAPVPAPAPANRLTDESAGQVADASGDVSAGESADAFVGERAEAAPGLAESEASDSAAAKAAPPVAADAETDAAMDETEPLVRRAALRMFRRQDGIWTQAGFDPAHDDLQAITRDGTEWRALLDQEPRLGELAAWETAVRFRYAGVWYLLEAPATR